VSLFHLYDVHFLGGKIPFYVIFYYLELNLNQLHMKKTGILLGLILVLGMNCQCTEDDDMEANVASVKMEKILSGEEGDQDTDNGRK
jgi:hypothetical protein